GWQAGRQRWRFTKRIHAPTDRGEALGRTGHSRRCAQGRRPAGRLWLAGARGHTQRHSRRQTQRALRAAPRAGERGRAMKWLQRLKLAPAPDANATKPTEPGFVGFVACPAAPSEKFTVPQQRPANEASANPDRWCWPHGAATNTAEIDTFTARL